MSKTPNQVKQNLENALASLKEKTGKSQNNLTDVVDAMATNSRAETTLVSTVNSNKLVFTAKNEQKEGYVYKAADTEDIKTATVTLSIDGPTVTASHGDNKISVTVAAGAIEASATVNSPSITLTPSAITLVNKTATISGKTQVAATPTNSSGVSGQYYIAVEAGSTATNNTAAVNVTAIAKATTAGYLVLNTSDDATASATASATISATTTTHYIPLATGSYTVSGGALTGAGNITPMLTLSHGSDTNMNNIVIGNKDTTNYPYYFKVSATNSAGSKTITRAAVTSSVTLAGYIDSNTTQPGIDSSTATVTVSQGSGNSYIGLKAGSYSATQTITAASGTVSATLTAATGMTLGTAATTAPGSGPYLTVSGSGKVNIGAVTAIQSAGYIPSKGATAPASLIASKGDQTSNTTTIYYPIATVTRANTDMTVSANSTNKTLTITGTNNQDAGYTSGGSKSGSSTVELSIAEPVLTATTGVVTATATMKTDDSHVVTITSTQSLAFASISKEGPTVSIGQGYVANATSETIASATLNASGTASAEATVSPGNLIILVDDNNKNISYTSFSTTKPSEGYYLAVQANSASNSATTAITGTANAGVTEAGYAETTLTGSGEVAGTATISISAATSELYYAEIPSATIVEKSISIPDYETEKIAVGNVFVQNQVTGYGNGELLNYYYNLAEIEGSNLKPEYIVKGIKILGIEGIYNPSFLVVSVEHSHATTDIYLKYTNVYTNVQEQMNIKPYETYKIIIPKDTYLYTSAPSGYMVQEENSTYRGMEFVRTVDGWEEWKVLENDAYLRMAIGS